MCKMWKFPIPACWPYCSVIKRGVEWDGKSTNIVQKMPWGKDWKKFKRLARQGFGDSEAKASFEKFSISTFIIFEETTLAVGPNICYRKCEPVAGINSVTRSALHSMIQLIDMRERRIKFLNRRDRRERGELKERKEPDSARPQRSQRTQRLPPADAWSSVMMGRERMKLEHPRTVVTVSPWQAYPVGAGQPHLRRRKSENHQ